MKYQKLGNSGIEVSRVCLGTWALGGGSVWSDRETTPAETKSLLDACLAHGVNYIDTAPVYGMGLAEQLLGEALKGRRQDFVLQTKCSLNWRDSGGDFHYQRDGYTVTRDTRGAVIRKDVEDSLLRLQTDYIDSLIVHYVNPHFPVEETVSALEDMIREGKIRTYGLSNSRPGDLAEYMGAQAKASGGVCLVQELYSILSPFHGIEYFPHCREHNALFQTYGVLEEGFLTSPDFMERKFAPTDIRSRLPWVKPEYREGLRRAFEIWEPIRAAHNCSFSVLTEAWALAQCELMNLLVGMRRPQSVADTAKCVDIELTPEELRVMEESVQDIRVDMEDK